MSKNIPNAEGGTAYTTAQVQASPAKNSKAQSTLAAEIERQIFNPEFLDSPGLEACFGIKRSLAYSLEAEGLIRGVSLRRRGQIKGKKLWSVDSVRAYLNKAMEGVKQ